MSFFNVPNKKKKKDKVKDAVKAFMNATPRLFSQDSQHSIYSIESPPSLDSENSKTKPKKMKWSMFDRLRGKSKQNDDSTPALSKSSSIPPGQDSPHGVIPQSPERFKWGKEKKIVKPRRDSSPIEMLEAHLNQDMPIPVEAANKNLGSDKFAVFILLLGQYTDELSLSDSDSSSSEIEMLWGPESNDSSKEIEGGEVLNCILSELKSEVWYFFKICSESCRPLISLTHTILPCCATQQLFFLMGFALFCHL